MIVISHDGWRRLIRRVVPFVLIPAVILISAIAFRERFYLMTALAVVLLALLLFCAGFERRTIGVRRMVLAAIMTALCIVGRFLPFFKPVTALTILAALYLGGETGFLVGALAAVLSNFYFGQGPWTPFQMFAWGMIGLFAGIFSKPLKSNRFLLVLYGIITGIFFSLAMDVWTVLWYSEAFNGKLYLSAILTAAPFTALYAISNAVFLWLTADPIGKKLERIRIKYGL